MKDKGQGGTVEQFPDDQEQCYGRGEIGREQEREKQGP